VKLDCRWALDSTGCPSAGLLSGTIVARDEDARVAKERLRLGEGDPGAATAPASCETLNAVEMSLGSYRRCVCQYPPRRHVVALPRYVLDLNSTSMSTARRCRSPRPGSATLLGLSFHVGVGHTSWSDGLQQLYYLPGQPGQAIVRGCFVLARVIEHRHGRGRTVDLSQCVELGVLSKN
jgi:hypothetical protein